MEVRGKVAVVTGAAVETGRAIALRLAEQGAAVVIADLDESSGMDTVRAIEENGGTAAFVTTDMTDDADVTGMLAFARRWRGGPQILVNSAGGGGHIPPHFPDATPAQWGATLDLNLRGPMLATQLALEAMLESGGGGAIVNVSSTGGLGYRPYQLPEYAAAKAGAHPVHRDVGHAPRAARGPGELRRPGLDRDHASAARPGPDDRRGGSRDAHAPPDAGRGGRGPRARARRRPGEPGAGAPGRRAMPAVDPERPD